MKTKAVNKKNGSSLNKKVTKTVDKKKSKKAKKHNNIKTNANIEAVEFTLSDLESDKQDKSNITDERKMALLKKRQYNRAFRKVVRKNIGTYDVANICQDLNIAQIQSRIIDIKNKQQLSKTAKRKLSVLQRKLRLEESTNKSVHPDVIKNKSKKKKEQQTSTLVKTKQDNKDKILKKKNKQIKVKLEKNDQDDSNAENKNDKKKGDGNQGNVKKEIGTKRPISIESNESSKANKKNKVKIEEIKKKTVAADKSSDDKKKDIKNKRYVLLVGNLPSDITPEELKRYFLSKVHTISRVRIPFPKTETGRVPPRIAYVEVINNIDLEKGLSLNNTFLRKRKINVQYSAHGTKVGKKSNVVAKNKKLGALPKTGKLAGEVQHTKKALKKGK